MMIIVLFQERILVLISTLMVGLTSALPDNHFTPVLPAVHHAPAPVQPRRQRVHSLGRGAGGGGQVRGAVHRAAGAGEVSAAACVDITALDI